MSKRERARKTREQRLKEWRQGVKVGTRVVYKGSTYTVERRKFGGVLEIFRQGFMANVTETVKVHEVDPPDGVL